MRNLITDVPGLRVGHADDAALASGVTALIFDAPCVASIAIHGGAPGVRDAALLEPDMTVPAVDALVLSGGSAFGLDAMGGVQAFLRAHGRGFQIADVRVPIVPGAICFDLLNGGDKAWPRQPPYWELGYRAAEAAGLDFRLGTAGAGYGATTATLKGGLGSASAVTASGYIVGAIVVANAVGSATIGDTRHFWAAPYERNGEFGNAGWPPLPFSDDMLAMRMKGDARPSGPALENTTIAIVVTDAPLTKGQAKRLAVAAHDGMGRALDPSHAALDGDLIFAASTARNAREPDLRDLTEIGRSAAHCLARAIARGVYEAKALPFKDALPDWKGKFE